MPTSVWTVKGMPVSPATLRLYEHTIGRFLRWPREHHAEVRRFEDLDVFVVRQYRVELAAQPGLRGRSIQPETLSGADRALRTFGKLKDWTEFVARWRQVGFR